jgi:AraC family transcriptional regulator
MTFRVEEHPAKSIAGLFHKGAYHHIGQTFDRLGQARKSAYAPGQVFFASYLDHPGHTAEADLRSFAGFEASAEEEPDLERMEMPACRWAIFTHVGPYSGLKDSWMRAYEELAAQGLQTADIPDWEVYVDDCEVVPTDRLRTEIWISLSPTA